MISMFCKWQERVKNKMQFCTEQRLKPSAFYQWLRRYPKSISSFSIVPQQIVRGNQSTQMFRREHRDELSQWHQHQGQ